MGTNMPMPPKKRPTKAAQADMRMFASADAKNRYAGGGPKSGGPMKAGMARDMAVRQQDARYVQAEVTGYYKRQSRVTGGQTRKVK